jgi:hypothetical protein
MKKTLTEMFTKFFNVGSLVDKVGTALTPKHYNKIVVTPMGMGLVKGMDYPGGIHLEKTTRLIVKLTQANNEYYKNKELCFWMDEIVLM